MSRLWGEEFRRPSSISLEKNIRVQLSRKRRYSETSFKKCTTDLSASAIALVNLIPSSIPTKFGKDTSILSTSSAGGHPSQYLPAHMNQYSVVPGIATDGWYLRIIVASPPLLT